MDFRISTQVCIKNVKGITQIDEKRMRKEFEKELKRVVKDKKRVIQLLRIMIKANG